MRAVGVPDHYCLAMTWPFQLEGLRVVPVATGPDLLLDPDAVSAFLTRHGRAALLHCRTFGSPTSTPLRAALASARADGVRVVLDATHAPLEAPDAPCDYRVASLRKLLPLPDGAVVDGLGDPPRLGRSALDAEATRLSVAAAKLAASGGAADVARAHVLVDEAEALLDRSWTPSAMSEEARVTLAHLDVTTLIAGVARTARRLRALLAQTGWGVVNPRAGATPVVVSHPDADRVRARLRAAGLGSPIHWPRPPGLRRGTPWRSDLLVLPTPPSLPGPERSKLVALLGVPRDRVTPSPAVTRAPKERTSCPA